MISDKEHCRREKIAVFQVLLHQEIHRGKQWMGTTGSTFQGASFQLVQHAD